MSIAYSDGREIESQVYRLLREAKDLDSLTPIALSRYADWPVRYHLCPERGNLVRPLNFSGLKVLELGAGMGAVSRVLSETAESLYVVEGTQVRFNALSERLRDRTNWKGEVANIADFKTSEKFDVVCVVGVLEY